MQRVDKVVRTDRHFAYLTTDARVWRNGSPVTYSQKIRVQKFSPLHIPELRAKGIAIPRVLRSEEVTVC